MSRKIIISFEDDDIEGFEMIKKNYEELGETLFLKKIASLLMFKKPNNNILIKFPKLKYN